MSQDLPTITLGRTGLTVTRLGIGGAYNKTVEARIAALDSGVTYVDTARSYQKGEDERLVGQAIAGRRDGLVLATKSGKRDAAGGRAELEESLRALRVDYIDIWQLHHLNTAPEREQALGPGGAYEAALKARDQGLIRYIGVTGHDWVQVGAAVETGLFDTVLCWYNCAMQEPETLVFPHTRAQDMGVIIMSSARNDNFFSPSGDPPDDAFYRYTLAYPGVHVAILGLRDVERFRRIARALVERGVDMPDDERRALEAYGARMREEGRLELHF
jgi:aryl-alcohol dehydrogenase-like predicted oxidoreductase